MNEPDGQLATPTGGPFTRATPARTCVIVLGMHRSAVRRCLLALLDCWGQRFQPILSKLHQAIRKDILNPAASTTFTSDCLRRWVQLGTTSVLLALRRSARSSRRAHPSRQLLRLQLMTPTGHESSSKTWLRRSSSKSEIEQGPLRVTFTF